MLSVVCLLLVPGFLLMTHRGVDLVPLVLAALGWISFLASCLVNGVSVLWPNAIAPAAFALYFIGLDGADRPRGGSDSDGSRGNRRRHGRLLPDRGDRAHPHRQFPRPLEIRHRPLGDDPHPVRADDGRGCLRLCNRWCWRCSDWPVSGLTSGRTHSCACSPRRPCSPSRFLGSRIRRGWQFAGIIGFGLVFAYVMPIAARAGLFGPALQRKTIEQDATNLPMLLAGRTEPPMTITAILERPLLGWGSAMNLTPDVYTQAEHLAVRMGFAPTFPFDLYWRLPPSDYSAMHSILLGSWAEGGVLAVLLPAWLLVACLGIVWNNTRFGRVGAARRNGCPARDLGPDLCAVDVQHDRRVRLHRAVVLRRTFPRSTTDTGHDPDGQCGDPYDRAAVSRRVPCSRCSTRPYLSPRSSSWRIRTAAVPLPSDDRIMLLRSDVGGGPARCRQLGIDAAQRLGDRTARRRRRVVTPPSWRGSWRPSIPRPVRSGSRRHGCWCWVRVPGGGRGRGGSSNRESRSRSTCFVSLT